MKTSYHVKTFFRLTFHGGSIIFFHVLKGFQKLSVFLLVKTMLVLIFPGKLEVLCGKMYQFFTFTGI